MAWVLGVDGGNTKTVALVATTEGEVAGRGRAGCSDIYSLGSPEAGLAVLDVAMGAALDEAGLAPGDLAAAAFSLAGADWPEDFEALTTGLAARGFGRRLSVYNDAIGALRAGSPDGCGVSVVCGTGTATGARAPGGRLWHSSWWQDPQGAGDLGKKTLQAVFEAELGLRPPTRLTRHVLALLGTDTVEAALHRLTARSRPPQPDLARLAGPLLDEAAAGDIGARAIVQAHGAALGDYALVAARKVGLVGSAFALVLAGGVLRHPSRLLAAALVERVQAAEPGAQPIYSQLEPAAGAVLLALESAGASTGPALLARLAATVPAAEFFSTRND